MAFVAFCVFATFVFEIESHILIMGERAYVRTQSFFGEVFPYIALHSDLYFGGKL